MSLLAVLAVIAAILAVPAVFNLVRRRDLRRMGVRNIVRRPVESILIIVGSALGTAIIVAALMVGDTFDNTIRDFARTELGEVDVRYEFDTPQELQAGFEAFASADIEELDGLLAVRSFQLAAAGSGTGDNRAVEPSIRVSAIDFGAARTFGSDPARHAFGTLEANPGAGDIVVNTDLAADLEVGVGDDVSLFALGNELSLQVVEVVEAVGFGGYSSAFVTTELVEGLDPTGSLTFDHVVASATGTIFDSVDASLLVFDDLEQALVANGIEAETGFLIKEDLLLDAEEEGAELTQIFSVVGGFSVLAGVLLLVNLFVMLAEERKPTLGVLRAIGWKRSALRRAFRTEGVVYATIAAVVGAVLGIGVGWAIVGLTRGILAASNPNSDFDLQLAIWPSAFSLPPLSV